MTDPFEIILIENNPFEAELAIKALKKNNLANNLLHIDNGEEALEFIFSKGKYEMRALLAKPKLILLDLKMPKVDGMQILKQIKSDEKVKAIPVVILTSSREQRDIIESNQLGAEGYLVKEVNFQSFTKSISEVTLHWLLHNNNFVQ